MMFVKEILSESLIGGALVVGVQFFSFGIGLRFIKALMTMSPYRSENGILKQKKGRLLPLCCSLAVLLFSLCSAGVILDFLSLAKTTLQCYGEFGWGKKEMAFAEREGDGA
jgi:hypothetical protein